MKIWSIKKKGDSYKMSRIDWDRDPYHEEQMYKAKVEENLRLTKLINAREKLGSVLQDDELRREYSDSDISRMNAGSIKQLADKLSLRWRNISPVEAGSVSVWLLEAQQYWMYDPAIVISDASWFSAISEVLLLIELEHYFLFGHILDSSEIYRFSQYSGLRSFESYFMSMRFIVAQQARYSLVMPETFWHEYLFSRADEAHAALEIFRHYLLSDNSINESVRVTLLNLKNEI